jgi:hypothetical protein
MITLLVLRKLVITALKTVIEENIELSLLKPIQSTAFIERISAIIQAPISTTCVASNECIMVLVVIYMCFVTLKFTV